MNKRQRKKRTRRCGFFHYDKEPEIPAGTSIGKSFNPYEDFSDEEMSAVASMGKKLMDPSFDADDLTEEEKTSFNKLTQRLYDEIDKFEDELILEYLDDMYGDDKNIEQDHYGNEADIIDIDEFTTEDDNNNG